MIEFIALTKELLHDSLGKIIPETRGFEFINWSEENFTRDLPDKWKFSIAVFIDSVISGFSINSNKSGIFYIHFFYIFNKHRSSKIGKNLLDACEKTALDNSIDTIRLICHKDNYKALNFYFRNGFYIKKIDENIDFQYLMEKKLN
jgi:ribosomal protein S18 acetylase RimI-like enzyme